LLSNFTIKFSIDEKKILNFKDLKIYLKKMNKKNETKRIKVEVLMKHIRTMLIEPKRHTIKVKKLISFSLKSLKKYNFSLIEN
jgi:hypothetical protein